MAAEYVLIEADLLRDLIATHNEPACGCRDSDPTRPKPCSTLAEARALLDRPPVRYDAFAKQVLTAPDPFYALAHAVGDHEGRLDALARRMSVIEAAAIEAAAAE